MDPSQNTSNELHLLGFPSCPRCKTSDPAPVVQKIRDEITDAYCYTCGWEWHEADQIRAS